MTPGDPVTAALRITDFGPDLIGAFQFDITFDPGQLTFTSAQFGAGLGDPVLEAIASVDDSTPGILDVLEVSFLSAAELLGPQTINGCVSPTGNSCFEIARFTFVTAPTLRSETLVLQNILLSDAAAIPSAIPNPRAVSVTIFATPEPSGLLLIGTGLALSAWKVAARRRRRDEPGAAAETTSAS